MKKSKKFFWLVWCIVTASSFFLLLAGVSLLLGNSVTVKNLFSFFILSFLFGFISSALYLLKRKLSFILFITGLAAGFFEMSRMFLSNSNGWGDLVGLISLFTWAAIGLASGAIAELCRFIYIKIISGKND